MQHLDSYNKLISRLEDFIRKYLRTQLLRGSLVSSALIASYLFAVNGIEYFAYLKGEVRFALFLGFVMLLTYSLVFQVLLPTYRLIFFRKFMSRHQAAQIIGLRLPEVADKLINLLQLGEQASVEESENTLLTEAIRQKSESLSLVPFVKAIDMQKTKKILRWSLTPLLILILTLLVFPNFLISPANRIINYNRVFEPPLPFAVKIDNEKLETAHNEDFELKISLSGEEIPEQFFLLIDGMKMEMKRVSTVEFTHIFRKVNRDIRFRVSGGRYLSQELLLLVHSKPRLISYVARLNFPAYLNREAEKLSNPSIVSLPAGTKVQITFKTRDAEELVAKRDSTVERLTVRDNSANYEFIAENSLTLDIAGKNRFIEHEDLLSLKIDVIRDEYPTISVNDLQEEALSRKRFFSGFVTDDYGFSNIQVIIARETETERDDQKTTGNIFYQPTQLRQNFYYSLDLDTLNLQPGNKINVQFKVTDNDSFKGPKSSLSQVFTYQIPSVDMLDSIRRKQETALEQKLAELQKNAASLKREVQKLSRKMLQKTEPDQNDRALINELVKQQLSLQQQMDQLRKERESINRFSKENELLNERLLEKQALIDKLVEEVLPEDLKKMMQELEQLLEKVNKDQLSDLLKKMEMSSEQMEKMLDRNLSLLKQLQFEKEMNSLMERLERIADELNKNADATADSKRDERSQLQQNINSIEEKFRKEMERLDSLKIENSTLEQPFRFEETQPKEDDVQKDLQDSKQLLQQNDNKNSAGKQRNASQKMKELKDQLMSMMQMNEEEQMAEDARLVRYLLENVLRISFRQEEIINQLSRMRRDDPAYSNVAKNQSMLLESFRVVDDSLTALAKRQPLVGNFVLDEVSSIKFRISEAQDRMKERLTAEATSSQQFAMMSLNNLALMLAESLKNMEESMGMPSSGKGKGKSKRQMPGNAMERMRQMQEALGKQLQEMMQGKQQGQGKSSMSEEIARMAAQQEALRQQMKNLIDQLKDEGQMGDGGLNKVLEDMEKLEERLVNKYLDEQTLRLQRNIEVRMLESEKALKEREQEERRESFEFKGENVGNLIDNSEYNRVMKMQQDMIRTSPLELQPFLKDRARNYFIRFNEMNRNGL